MPKKVANEATTVRFTRADKRNAQVIISSGAAMNMSEAVRVALYEAAARRSSQPRDKDGSLA